MMIAAVALAASAGCDWRDFDDLAQRAPVRRTGAPGDYAASNDFGRVVVTLPPPADAAARYVVSAQGSPALAMVDLDAAGKAHAQALNPPVIAEGGAFPVTSLAATADGKHVLMGSPASGAGRVYLMTAAPPPAVVLFASSLTEDHFGMGVATGELTGAATEPDLIVASATSLHVYPDGAAAAPLDLPVGTPCDLALDPALDARYRASRPVAVVGSHIVVGTPSATTFGTVSVFSVAGGQLTCDGVLTGTEGRFGQALTAGDFDGDGTPDLLVGAPPRAVYLFQGPLSAAARGDMVSYADSAGQFGAAVTAINVDGLPGDEFLVADPDAVVNDQQAAGAVLLYSAAALAAKPTRLAAHDPETGAAYGSSVSVLPFCPPPCPAAGPRRLALVGSGTQTFTYFLLRSTDMDPRHF